MRQRIRARKNGEAGGNALHLTVEHQLDLRVNCNTRPNASRWSCW